MSGSPSRRGGPADAAGAVEQGRALEPALGQAVAVGVDQPLRVGPVGVGGDEVLRRGAQRDEGVAVVDGADADGTRRPRRRRRPPPGCPAAGRARRRSPARSVAGRHRCLRRCAASAPRSGRWRPGSRATRPGAASSSHSEPAASTRVGDMVAGQLQRHIVLGQQHVRDAREQLRLVRRQPEQLGCREARHGRDAGDPAEVGDALHEQRGTRPGPARRSTGSPAASGRSAASSTTAPCIWPDRPIACVAANAAGARRAGRQHLAGRRPPGVGLLLRPERLRPRDRERHLGLGEQALLAVDQHGLDRGGADVDPEEGQRAAAIRAAPRAWRPRAALP